MYLSNVYDVVAMLSSPYLIADAFPYQNNTYASVGILIQTNPEDLIDPPIIDFSSI